MLAPYCLSLLACFRVIESRWGAKLSVAPANLIHQKAVGIASRYISTYSIARPATIPPTIIPTASGKFATAAPVSAGADSLAVASAAVELGVRLAVRDTLTDDEEWVEECEECDECRVVEFREVTVESVELAMELETNMAEELNEGVTVGALDRIGPPSVTVG